MDFVESMKKKAKSYGNSLVLPEGTEDRTVVAAATIAKEKLARSVILLGKKDDILSVAKKNCVELGQGIEFINPVESEWKDSFANEYYELRKAKGMTPEEAAKGMEDPLKFGAMMVRMGKTDAMVSGALSSTADLLRAGLTIIKTAPGTKTALLILMIQNGDMMVFWYSLIVPLFLTQQVNSLQTLLFLQLSLAAIFWEQNPQLQCFHSLQKEVVEKLTMCLKFKKEFALLKKKLQTFCLTENCRPMQHLFPKLPNARHLAALSAEK